MPVFKLLDKADFTWVCTKDLLEDFGADEAAKYVLEIMIDTCVGKLSRFQCLIKSQHEIEFWISAMLKGLNQAPAVQGHRQFEGDFENSVVLLDAAIYKDILHKRYNLEITAHIKDQAVVEHWPSMAGAAMSGSLSDFSKTTKSINSAIQAANSLIQGSALHAGSDLPDWLIKQMAKQISKQVDQEITKGMTGFLSSTGAAQEFTPGVKTVGYGKPPTGKGTIKYECAYDFSKEMMDMEFTSHAKLPKGPQPHKKFNVPKKLGFNKKGK